LDGHRCGLLSGAGKAGCNSLRTRSRALTSEPIKRPKQHRIELAAAGGLEHCLELDTVTSLAGGFVHKFLDDLPFLPLAELAQLACLVANVLALVLGAYPAVQRTWPDFFETNP
jgi:hypothetical protein